MEGSYSATGARVLWMLRAGVYRRPIENRIRAGNTALI
jgi:hypothetical protein